MNAKEIRAKAEAARKRMKSKVGRPTVGQAISIKLTVEQRDWLDSQIGPYNSRAAVVRAVIHKAMVGG